MNGVRCGEVAIDAGIVANHNVPTIMVSGDDKVCEESRQFIADVVTVQVKQGLDVEGAKLLSQPQALKLIRDGAAEAVAKCKSIKPYKVEAPVTMRLELVSRGRIPVTRKAVKVIDGHTYEVTADSVEAALQLL